jgi:pSer/pThr/pTyr-binding forkhead associated (FHA) protein
LIQRKDAPEVPSPVLELLVHEGADAGEVFTVDGDEVMIGRRLPEGRHGRGILLKDPTVSARQAVIRRRNATVLIQHMSGATNPTLVDGEPAEGALLRPGSWIDIGRVRIEVRERDGFAISHLTQVFSAEAKREASRSGTHEVTSTETTLGGETEQMTVPPLPDEGDTTEIRPVVTQLGELVVVGGMELMSEKSFPIWSTGTTLGRATDNDVQLPDMGISRNHAELVLEGNALVLVHHSKVNPTLLNGCEVLDREFVGDGDRIQLADRVVLSLELRGVGGPPVEESADEARRRTLKQEMEQKVELDRRIEQKYSVDGSFLDVDIVNSYGMKAESGRPEHIVVSFERFRAFVGGVVEEFGGHVLNSNGDELMCYFESTHDSVRAAACILARLEQFNLEQNLLRVPFRFRLGIHTGRCLVDLDQGVAYSPVLDVAGHLQKLADHDGLMISEHTFAALPDGLPFEHVGTMEREGLGYYRLVGGIE